MNQDLIVFAILGLTVTYISYSFIKSLRTKKVSSGCGSCSGCSGCEIKAHSGLSKRTSDFNPDKAGINPRLP